MADYTILASIFNTANAATAHYISDTVADVCGAVSPMLHSLFLLYFMLWGFAMYRGLIQEPILDGGFRLMRVGLILHLAVNVGAYSGIISSNLANLPGYLTDLVGAGGSGTAGGDSWTTLDSILSNAIDTGTAVWEQGSLLTMSIGPYIMAVIIWGSSLICTGYAAFLMILSKVALAIIIGLGPIFIACLMFDGTKKYFEAWAGQAINYCLVSALAVATIKLLFGMYDHATAGAMALATTGDAAAFGFKSIASMLVLSVICFLVLLQVTSIASGLAGGVSVSSIGAVRWASSKAHSAAGAMRPSNIQRSIRSASRDLRAMKAGSQRISTPAKWAYRKVVGSENTIRKAS